jgi:hypothetical protein
MGFAISAVRFNWRALALDCAGFVEAFTERGDIARGGIGRPYGDEADDRHCRLLRLGCKRPCGHAAERG